MSTRTCVTCAAPFAPRNQNQKYCARTCRPMIDKYWSGLNLTSGTVGAVAELVVSTDLMRRGFEVYRALSPSSSCDLLILRDGKTLSVEVRSAARNTSGRLVVSKRNIRAEIVAHYIHQLNEIIYEPPIGPVAAST